jgi:uncharacterized protein YcfL
MRIIIGVLVLLLLTTFVIIGCGSKEQQEPAQQETSQSMEQPASQPAQTADTMHQMTDTTMMQDTTMQEGGGE